MSEAKPIELVSGHRTKEEIEKRIEAQEKIKGDNSRVLPTKKLSQEQESIFNSIKDEMKESNLLSNLDSYLLTQLSIAIDKLNYLDSVSIINPKISFNKEYRSTYKLNFDIFTKCCNELAMSPQGRAKLANINSSSKNKKEDPVVKALEKFKNGY